MGASAAAARVTKLLGSRLLRKSYSKKNLLGRGLVFCFLPRATVHQHDQLHALVLGGDLLRNEAVVGQTLGLAALVLCTFLQHHSTQRTAGVGKAQRSIFESEHSRLRIVVAVWRCGVSDDRHFGVECHALSFLCAFVVFNFRMRWTYSWENLRSDATNVGEEVKFIE